MCGRHMEVSLGRGERGVMTRELVQNICPAFPHSGGQRTRSSLCWEVGTGAHRNPAYLCLMELPRSLRGICGDQRGTDSVSAGREERRRARYTAVGSSQALEGRGRLTGFRKDSDHLHHLLNQSQMEHLTSARSPGQGGQGVPGKKSAVGRMQMSAASVYGVLRLCPACAK